MTKAYVVSYYSGDGCCRVEIDKVFTTSEQAERYAKNQERKTGLIYDYEEVDIW